MRHASTGSVGLDVHQDSIAVADVAKDHYAEVVYVGTLGTRHGDLAQRIRHLPSTATQRVFVYEAGPWGDGLYCSLRKQGYACWVVAPSRRPKQAGDRVNTDRRDAVQLARLRRSGALTSVYVPKEADAAIRDLKAATCRLNAV